MAAPEERDHFSNRLQLALDRAGWRALGPTGMAREFNLRSRTHAITPHAARKWLQGEAIPTQDKLRVLAEWLEVRAEWLRFGDMQPTGPVYRQGVAMERPPAAYGQQRSVRLASDFAQLDSEQQQVVEDLVRVLLRHSSSNAR